MEEEKNQDLELERQKNVEEAKKKLTELLENEEIKEMISNNEIEFVINDVKYKVTKPGYKERQKTYKKRCEKQIELLKEKNPDGTFKNSTEADLIKLYKERGIDINYINRQIMTLLAKEKDLKFKLGEALKKQEPNNILETYKKEISNLRDSINDLAAERGGLLDVSIEGQVLIFIYSYYAYLMTKKLENDKWVDVWKSFEEYYNDKNEELINTATSYVTLLINNQSLEDDK